MTHAARRASRLGRKAEILRAFTRHVAKSGFDGTNFAEIALELGMSKGTIVHHFGSKDRLLAEAHEAYLRRRLAEAHAIVDRLRAPAEQLAGLAAAFVLYQAHDRDGTLAFQREVVRSRQGEPMATVRRLRDHYRELVAGVIRAGIADGSFRRGDDQLWTLLALGSSQWMWTWYDPDGDHVPDDVAACFVDLVLGALLRDRAELAELSASDGAVFGVVRHCFAASAESRVP